MYHELDSMRGVTNEGLADFISMIAIALVLDLLYSIYHWEFFTRI